MVRCSWRFGRNDCPVVQCSRSGSSGDRGLALIHGSPQLRVGAGSLYMLSLNGYWRDVPLACRGLVFRPRARGYPTLTTVVAYTIHARRVVGYRCVLERVSVDD